MTIFHSLFTQNKAEWNGIDSGHGGGARILSYEPATVKISDSTFSENMASGNTGGGLFLEIAPSSRDAGKLDASKFQWWTSQSELTISGCTFTKNQAFPTTRAPPSKLTTVKAYTSGEGGGAYVRALIFITVCRYGSSILPFFSYADRCCVVHSEALFKWTMGM